MVSAKKSGIQDPDHVEQFVALLSDELHRKKYMSVQEALPMVIRALQTDAAAESPLKAYSERDLRSTLKDLSKEQRAKLNALCDMPQSATPARPMDHEAVKNQVKNLEGCHEVLRAIAQDKRRPELAMRFGVGLDDVGTMFTSAVIGAGYAVTSTSKDPLRNLDRSKQSATRHLHTLVKTFPEYAPLKYFS